MTRLLRLPPRATASLLLVCLLIGALLGGCGGGLAPVDSYGPAPPGYVRVQRGDTLSEIAERERVRMRTLAAWNGLSSPYTIYAGALLRVEPPNGARVASRRSTSTPSRSRSTAQGAARPVKTSARPPASVAGADAASSGIRWQWPVQGPLKQGFRSGDRTRSGIRIGAAQGSAVHSAADGVVVYSGSGLKGYGNLIIVKHDNNYLSAYGYNRQLLAAEGDRVRAGQQLAEVGRAANGESLLHFEIRRNGVAVDPLRFLPPPG